MEIEILEKLKQQDEKIDKILQSVNKIRRYFLLSLILTIIFFVLPIIAIAIVIPWFINTYLGSLGAASGGSLQILEGIGALSGH